MKGIILAGGKGTRLYPSTKSISKQLIMLYDKPLIYYPLSVLMLNSVREILIITTPEDQLSYKNLLGDGSQLGLTISYATQAQANGIAEAFIIGEEFIGNGPVVLILGDNIFYGDRVSSMIEENMHYVKQHGGGVIFGYYVADPERYGVIGFNAQNDVISIVEKPITPESNYAVIGLYIYDHEVIDIAKSLTPSQRGEIEITEINQKYLNRGKLKVELLGRGMAWLDTGTHDAMLEASNFVSIIEKRQNLKIACIEEIAYKKGFISMDQLLHSIKGFENTPYCRYLLEVIETIQPYQNKKWV